MAFADLNACQQAPYTAAEIMEMTSETDREIEALEYVIDNPQNFSPSDIEDAKDRLNHINTSS